MEKRQKGGIGERLKTPILQASESLNKLAERYEIPLRTIERQEQERELGGGAEKTRHRRCTVRHPEKRRKRSEASGEAADVAEDVADLIGTGRGADEKLREKRKKRNTGGREK